MRDRHLQPRSNPQPCDDVPSVSAASRGIPVARIFSPAELDLDDLAEAIRVLLAPADSTKINPPLRPKPELLSFPRRGTHVVEANETP